MVQQYYLLTIQSKHYFLKLTKKGVQNQKFSTKVVESGKKW
jgi:hypothetical protein